MECGGTMGALCFHKLRNLRVAAILFQYLCALLIAELSEIL